MNQAVRVIDLASYPISASRRGRVKQIRSKKILLETGLPDVRLEFSFMYVPDGYFTPRHRHHFEQIRYTIDGIQSLGLGPDVPPDTGPGVCSYTPEGVYYGPQEQKGDCTSLLVQFTGPTRVRFLNGDEMNTAFDSLQSKGVTFENGLATFVGSDGTPTSRDSYEAIFEEFVGQALVMPAARYVQPSVMNSESFRWVDDRANPNMQRKHLGSFTEHRTSASQVKLLPGCSIDAGTQEDTEILYLLEGSVTYDGKPWNSDVLFYLPYGAKREGLFSGAGATFFSLKIPMVGDLVRAQSRQGGLVASSTTADQREGSEGVRV